MDGAQTFTMVAGETGTLTAKKGDEEVPATFTIIEGASLVTLNGSQVTANAAGEVTVKATTADGMETTDTISISLPETFEISGPSEVMAGGDPIKLEIDKPYGTFTWSASNGNATVDGNGNVTGVTKGEVVITATRNDGVKATYNVTIKGEPDLPNSTAVLSSNHSVSIPSGYSATKIVIEFERTSGSNNFYFQLNGSQGGGNVNTVNGEWKFVGGHPWGTGINEGYTFVSDGEKALGTLTFGDNISVLDLIPNGSSWNIRYVLTCKNASGEEKYVVYPSSVSRTAPQQVRAASVAAEEIMPMLGDAATTNTSVGFVNNVATITLSPTSNPEGEAWTYVAKNLDVYDANGQPYYYWVEEVGAGEGGLSNYEVSYLFDDADGDTTYAINAANPGNAMATIRNTKTQNESYELPSTGGIGTRWYTIAGLLVLGGGCGGFATTHLIRRFRRRKCTK